MRKQPAWRGGTTVAYLAGGSYNFDIMAKALPNSKRMETNGGEVKRGGGVAWRALLAGR